MKPIIVRIFTRIIRYSKPCDTRNALINNAIIKPPMASVIDLSMPSENDGIISLPGFLISDPGY
jgi:hypothetical protein